MRARRALPARPHSHLHAPFLPLPPQLPCCRPRAPPSLTEIRGSPLAAQRLARSIADPAPPRWSSGRQGAGEDAAWRATTAASPVCENLRGAAARKPARSSRVQQQVASWSAPDRHARKLGRLLARERGGHQQRLACWALPHPGSGKGEGPEHRAHDEGHPARAPFGATRQPTTSGRSRMRQPACSASRHCAHQRKLTPAQGSGAVTRVPCIVQGTQ